MSEVMEQMPEALRERMITNEQLEKVARLVVGIAAVPEFSNEKIPTKVVASIYGKSETWVRNGIIEGWLPIGHGTKSENRRNVYVSPKKLWEDTGYIWRGKEGAGSEGK